MREGKHRPFLAASFLNSLRRSEFNPSKYLPKEVRARCKCENDSPLDLHAMCMNLIAKAQPSLLAQASALPEASPASAIDPASRIAFDDLVNLLEELARHGIFVMAKLVRKVASLNPSANAHNGQAQVLLQLLRCLPFDNAPLTLRTMRRQCIYGNRTTESWEEAAQRRATRELKGLLPKLFMEGQTPASASEADSEYSQECSTLAQIASELERVPKFWSATRYVQRQVVRGTLLPALESALAQNSIALEELALAIALLERSEDPVALAQVSGCMHACMLVAEC